MRGRASRSPGRTHLTASVGLIRAAEDKTSDLLVEWAGVAANRLGRLYGPANPDLGLEAQRYMEQTGARAIIEAALGSPLTAKYTFPPYD